jgi:hypothetical protein
MRVAALAGYTAAQMDDGSGGSAEDGAGGVLEEEPADEPAMAWWRLAELVFLGTLGTLLGLGLLWHFSTFSSWIDRGLEYGAYCAFFPSQVRAQRAPPEQCARAHEPLHAVSLVAQSRKGLTMRSRRAARGW